MNEPEPLYEYVKGKGWVAANRTVTLACGTVCTWQRRLPEPGEYNFTFYSYRTVEECLEKMNYMRLFHASREKRYDDADYQVFVLTPV